MDGCTVGLGTTLNKRQRNEKVDLIDEDVSANSICGSHAEGAVPSLELLK